MIGCDTDSKCKMQWVAFWVCNVDYNVEINKDRKNYNQLKPEFWSEPWNMRDAPHMQQTLKWSWQETLYIKTGPYYPNNFCLTKLSSLVLCI